MPNLEAELASVGVILAHFFGYLPAFATFAAICWYAINIWESETVRLWFGRGPKKGG